MGRARHDAVLIRSTGRKQQLEYGRPQFAAPALTPGVKLLLLINVAVFIATFLVTTVVGLETLGAPLSHYLGVSWDGMTDWYGLGSLRLLTHLFAHSYTSIFHILMNMLVLYFFGTMVEGEVGKRGILHLYLIGGLAGGVLQLVFFLAMGEPQGVAVGASGACYGIMVYAACMAPRMRVIFIVFPIEMRWLVGLLVFVGVYSSILELQGVTASSTAHGGHLGGALYGFVAFRLFRGYYTRLAYGGAPLFGWFHRWRAERTRKSAIERQQTLDRLLEKVHREGMSALSGAERRFLEKASKDMRD